MKLRPYVAYWPGTPGGHIPFLADEALSKKRSDTQVKEAASRSRQTALKSGITGTLRALSAGSHGIKGDVSKGQVAPKKKPEIA